jgi:hypothetical protein
MVTWNSTIEEAEVGGGSYNAEVVTIKIVTTDREPAIAVVVSYFEAKDVRRTLTEHLLALEGSPFG